MATKQVMMAKRHIASFGDVFKHSILSRLFLHARQRDRAMTYLDFFPGPGAYDLDLFPNEARGDGAEKLWEVFGAIHPSRIESIRGQQSVSELRAYLSALRRYNQPSLFQSEADVFGAHPMRHYPGSPLLAHYFLRPQDNAVFVDDDEQSLSQLQSLIGSDRRYKFVHDQLPRAARAFMPPRTHAGLAFFDPPYEKPDTKDKVIQLINHGFHRWPTGMYAFYYPLRVEHHETDEGVQRFTHPPIWLYNELRRVGFRNILRVELDLGKRLKDGGADLGVEPIAPGMVIVNAPYNFDSEMNDLLETLAHFFLPGYQAPLFPNPYTVKTTPAPGTLEEQKAMRAVLDEDEQLRITNIQWPVDRMPLEPHDHNPKKRSFTFQPMSVELAAEEDRLMELARLRKEKLAVRERKRLAKQKRLGTKALEKTRPLDFRPTEPFVPVVENAFTAPQSFQLPVPSTVSYEPMEFADEDLVQMALGRAAIAQVAHKDDKRPRTTTVEGMFRRAEQQAQEIMHFSDFNLNESIKKPVDRRRYQPEVPAKSPTHTNKNSNKAPPASPSNRAESNSKQS